jgi:drug/metabolite transporter (DMT)-like permease
MHRGIVYALSSAVLFGLSTPFAKQLTENIGAVSLAGLLYAGAGVGLLSWRAFHGRSDTLVARDDIPWFAGAILTGGILAPVALMLGLSRLPAATTALLLNLEVVFTAVLAWFVFREHVGRRVAFGMTLIVGGGVSLAWSGIGIVGGISGVAWVSAACLLWALDNNLTRHVSAADPLFIAGMKGLIAGAVNLAVALAMGEPLPATQDLFFAGGVGLLGYGMSLVLFVLALRELGAARTGAYFSLAPFVGAAGAFLLLQENPAAGFWTGLALMGTGVWLHITEHHVHEHRHEALTHCHEHVHDDHHQHHHDFPWDGDEPHTHPHEHTVLIHSHPHFPDLHHRHIH